MKQGVAALLPLVLLAGCGGSSAKAGGSTERTEDISAYPGEEKGNETYPDYDERRDSYYGGRGEYAGDGCTVDCGGHEAGYAWAERKGIEDPDDCGGRSWSFEEGCRAYAEEQQRATMEDADQ